jgi:hypothetical protein
MAYQVQYPILSLPPPVLDLNYVAYPNVERNKILTRPTGAEAIGYGCLQKLSDTFVRLLHIVHSLWITVLVRQDWYLYLSALQSRYPPLDVTVDIQKRNFGAMGSLTLGTELGRGTWFITLKSVNEQQGNPTHGYVADNVRMPFCKHYYTHHTDLTVMLW